MQRRYLERTFLSFFLYLLYLYEPQDNNAMLTWLVLVMRRVHSIIVFMKLDETLSSSLSIIQFMRPLNEIALFHSRSLAYPC